MENEGLTEKKYWDSHWERIRLPAEIKKETANILNRELLRVFDKYLPRKEGANILEIGGAPGHFLAFFAKDFHYSVTAIDYSEIGCRKMKENFEMLHINAMIYNRNIISNDLSDLPRFDIVYSLGFIEHFRDIDPILEKHVHLVKEDGILMIGVPNFSGITELILRKTSPHILSTHNIRAMDLRTWEAFEEKYLLRPIFKGYLGGFDLHHCRRCERRTPLNRLIRLFFKMFTGITNRTSFLRRFNSRIWSPYLLVIYRTGQQTVHESRLSVPG